MCLKISCLYHYVCLPFILHCHKRIVTMQNYGVALIRLVLCSMDAWSGGHKVGALA